MMTRVLTMLLAGLLALPLAAEAQKTIKVGMPMPLSGPPALFGEPASKGAQMFVDEINAKGGVLGGRKLELIVRDSKADANEAVRVARELILKDNVDFLVGTLTSAEGRRSRWWRRRTRSSSSRPFRRPISSPPPTSCTRTCSAYPPTPPWRAGARPRSWPSGR
jgi:hypothetical protein